MNGGQDNREGYYHPVFERHASYAHTHREPFVSGEVNRFVARKVSTEAADGEAGMVRKLTDSTVPLYTRRNGVTAAHLRG